MTADDRSDEQPDDAAWLDDESSREAWAALGRLLEPSAAPLDDATAARTVRAVLRRAERRRRRRAGLLLLASAAAVLLWIGKPRLPEAPPQAAPQQTAAGPVVEPAPSSVAAAPDAFAWEDPWDEELADAQEYVRDVELDWARDADQVTYFGERLEALEAEWNASPL